MRFREAVAAVFAFAFAFFVTWWVYHHAPPAAMESRSPLWPRVRAAHLANESACAVCGATTELQIHHIRPVHLFKAGELDPENLITLCRVHHFWVGHLGSWQAYNPDVRQDAAHWKARIRARKYE